MTEREINGDSTGTFLTLINDWEIPFFTVCRQKSSDGSFEDFVNSICNCISFTKVLVPALFALRGASWRRWVARDGAARAGLASSAPRACAKLTGRRRSMHYYVNYYENPRGRWSCL